MFGIRLRQLREEKKLTQRNIAAMLNVSDRTISYYESNERTPDPDTLIKLARFFNVSIDYLLGQTDHGQVCHGEINDIGKFINNAIAKLKGSTDIYLDSEPASKAAIDEIISALRVGLEKARKKNNKTTRTT